MCLKESMRMNPPVLFIQRETTQTLEFDGRKVPAGTLINIHFYNILTNHTVWEDPLVNLTWALLRGDLSWGFQPLNSK